MQRMVAVTLVGTVIGVIAAGEPVDAPAQTVKASSSHVEGVWRIAELTITGANPSSTVDPPSLLIFTPTHYSMMRTVGPQPRASFVAINPTSEEKVAAYDSFIANSGTYELSGTTLTTRPIVSKHPNYMGGGFDTYEVRSAGDTLWFTNKSTNIRYRFADGLKSIADPVDNTTVKMIRVR